MSKPTDWHPPPGVDVNVPSAARIYDYSLGGAHNFAADRLAARELFAAYPDAPLVGRANRAFLQRAVRFCQEEGISQFLDLGSGIPTVGNVHEAAQKLDPDCRVVYVDNEPVAVAHTLQLLESVPGTAVVQADIRDVSAVLGASQTRELLDFSQPVALMMVAVLHYVSPHEDVSALVNRYTAALAPGSLLVISHTTEDPRPEVAAAIRAVFNKTPTPVTHRNREEVTALFNGLELVEPGVVWTPQWRPEDPSEPLFAAPQRSATFAGVARIPG